MKSIATIILLILSVSLNAQEEPIDFIKKQDYLKYRNRVNCDSAITTAEIRICANLRYQRLDSVLQVTYEKSIDYFKDFPDNPGFVEKIEAAHTAWKHYRNTQCGLVYEQYQGGSIAPVFYMECLSDLTEERIEVLDDLLINEP